MSHTCSCALVRCIDFRLGSAIRDYLNAQNLYNDIDIISVAGAAKDIAENEPSFVEGQVDLSCKLHDTKAIVLMNHTDCGAYGGRAAFDSDEAERAKHVEDLCAARDKILKTHPDADVRLALAVIGKEGTVTIVDVPCK